MGARPAGRTRLGTASLLGSSRSSRLTLLGGRVGGGEPGVYSSGLRAPGAAPGAQRPSMAPLSGSVTGLANGDPEPGDLFMAER